MAAQQKNQGGKGNPANTRMSNPARAVRRALSWQHGEKCKLEHASANRAQATANDILREDGQHTPWETAKALRAYDRSADPAVQQRARRWAA